MDKRKKLKKYLPSKKFTLLISSFVVLLVIVLITSFFFSKKEIFSNFRESNSGLTNTSNESVLDLIKKDQDGDSVPDWEESLWGTDKTKQATFDGTPDAKYIEARKKESNIEEDINNNKENATDQFARQFFTSYVALNADGQDANSVNNFAKALGERVANPELENIYSEKDVKISTRDDAETRNKYYEKLQTMFDQYRKQGLGEELSIVNSGLLAESSTGGSVQTDKLNSIGNAYIQFAKKVMQVEAPRSFAEYHLQIANTSNNVGISVENMAHIVDDPIIGITGLSQYQKYAEELSVVVTKLESDLDE